MSKMDTGPVGRLPLHLPPNLGGVPGRPDPDPGTNQKPRVSWSWGTVVSTDPIQVVLDGPGEQPYPVKEANCLMPISALSPPTRVWTQLFGRRLLIIGQARGGTDWEPCVLEGGIKPRENNLATYGPMVRMDSSGLVHFQGQFDPDGIPSTGSSQVICTVPEGYEPRSEVRWIGFSTSNPHSAYGGWIGQLGGNWSGQLVIRVDTANNNWPPPDHWCVIVPSWEPVPVDQR